MSKVPCAILGSGNIGTDLLQKVLRSDVLEVVALCGIDPDSDGLARARTQGVETSTLGIDWVMQQAPGEVQIVFDATSASAHRRHAPLLADAGIRAVDLTPAAVGPAVVPSVNLDEHVGTNNVSLITCGGQATTPIVAAIGRVAHVAYAEIVSTVASKSAGPGTRQNIDAFTRTTSRGLQTVGGARRGKAIMVLNPADPAIIMRNTVYCSLPEDAVESEVVAAVRTMVASVQRFVPGYRQVGEVIFDDGPFNTPSGVVPRRVTVLLEVESEQDYFPAYAGNLDIMTAAARRVGETMASSVLLARAGAQAGAQA